MEVYTRKLCKLALAIVLSATMVSVMPVNANELVMKNDEVHENNPCYTQVADPATTFRYQNNTYTLNTSWLMRIEDNTGRLINAEFIGALSNLPDPLYQSTTVKSSRRLNDTQIEYTLNVSIMLLGIIQSTVTAKVVVKSPGPM